MKKSPREDAGLFSKLFFCWMYGMLGEGSKRELNLDDIYEVSNEDKSNNLGNKLEEEWKKELEQSRQGIIYKNNENNRSELIEEKQQPKLWKALIRVFGIEFGLLGIIAFIDECGIKVIQPLLLGYLIRYFGGEFNVLEGYLFGSGVILCSMLYVTQHHPYFFGIQHVGMRSRVAVSSLVYRKGLKLSVGALRDTTIGQMVNFLSNDVSRFDQAPLMAWYLLIGPIQLGIVVYILWGYYSYVCLVGIGFLILFVPFQSFMGSLFGRMRQEVAVKSDKRIRIMNEIVSAIKVIKMYTWEKSFSKLVQESRKYEVQSLRKVAYLKAMNFGLYFVSSKIVIFLTLLTYVLTGNYLTSEKVFVTLALYNNVRIVLTLFFPYGMSYMAELIISIRRLENFLLMEERIIYPINGDLSIENEIRDGGLIIRNLCCKWYPNLDEWTLDNINLKGKKGELIGIIGPVGGSKSSLLQGILGELPRTFGEIFINGRIGFSSQEPWIFSGTVRENILFGSKYNENWYEKVIDACALTRDISLLPNGDGSLVGDRGISLSGGQKARINLARVVYADRDIYLLDDPLSAVDSHVGKHLFNNCIRGILRSKTVILVTHQLQFLKGADKILLLKNGRIEIEGNYNELLNSGINFTQLIHSEETSISIPPILQSINKPIPRVHSDSGLRSRLSSIEMNIVEGYSGPVTEFEDNELERSLPPPSISQSLNQGNDKNRRRSTTSLKASLKKRYGTFGPSSSEQEEEPGLIKESHSSGNININLYWKYIKSGSNWISISFLIITAILTQIFLTGSDYWLQFWTQIEENNQLNKTKTVINNSSWIVDITEELISDRELQIGIYCFIIGCLFISSLSRTIIFTNICLRSSISLHGLLFGGVIRSPMKFFEDNPVGRILNRFARDVGVIDEYLPLSLFDTWEIPFQGFGIFLIVTIMSPILIIPAIILLCLFYKIRKYYLHTARSLKRLESITRSPVFTHLSSSFYGLSTIRALNVESGFSNTFDSLQDTHSACWYVFLASSRWVGITLDWVSIGYIGVITYSFMLSNLDGSQVGLAVSSALTLTGLFQWGVRQSAEAENQMVSVERVFEYSELKPEPPLTSTPENKPPESWPFNGEIIFNNLYIKYGDDEPILKDINIKIQSSEKIGIVGRTGAGKSSIISSLFRMVDPYIGVILIDGINIFNIGLHDLRSKISIIPQDPVLFFGSIRNNLDPFNEYQDNELWNVLEDVHLKKSIQDMNYGLNYQISEGGGNFSVGERQLICLGRAILRKNKILVLDEATANVDPETDVLIQNTIRQKFNECTVLTVAHRLHTVMDSDRILVLDGGRVMEFDIPFNLLQNKGGSLYQLTQQTGKSSADQLFKIAKNAYDIKKYKNGGNKNIDIGGGGIERLLSSVDEDVFDVVSPGGTGFNNQNQNNEDGYKDKEEEEDGYEYESDDKIQLIKK